MPSLKGLLTPLAIAFFASALYGQDAKPADSSKPQTNNDEVLILVNVTADSLRFDAVPNTKVEFPGTHERTKVWVTQRQNLPEQVQPGVTYRNIGLQLTISTRFSEIERIVREALGQDASPTGSVAEQPQVQTPPLRERAPAASPATAQPPPSQQPPNKSP